MFPSSFLLLLVLAAPLPPALCRRSSARGYLPEMDMTEGTVPEKGAQPLSGTKDIAWTLDANQEAVLALVVPGLVTRGQERFMRVNLIIDALDQAGRALRAEAHIMSLVDSLEGRASFFHWSYPDVGGDGKCWVRVHATDRDRHPCSTSHTRKHPALYPLLYPDLYPSGPPGPISQRLQCDMTEFSHVDVDQALNYERFIDETTPMCIEVQIKLAPASADRQSSEARTFLWYKNSAKPMSGRVTSQLNGFFNYADVRDPTTADYPVSKLFLRALKYDITAVEGERPVFRIGSYCGMALRQLSQGTLQESPPKGHAPPKAKEVGLSGLASIPHPVPKMCFPDLAMKDFDTRGNAYRVALRDQARVIDGKTRLKVPDFFYKLKYKNAFQHRPLTYNFFNTYLSNGTSKFLTIAFQEPVSMFADDGHTHMMGAARMERLDESGQYYVHALPFTLVFLWGYSVRSLVAAYRDDNFGIMLYARPAYTFRNTKCFCGMEAESVPACTKGDCSEEWKNPTSFYLLKVAGVKPDRRCCSTQNCLNPNFNWDKWRL